jgi:GNAT superfamily N-acetyltransferase
MEAVILADLALSQRLERCEGRANAALVEARGAPSAWIEVAGAYALFDGPGSPLTQTFGLGIFETPSAADLDRIEAFFAERGAQTFHEVSPIAPVVNILTERGYRPVELTSVLYLPLSRRTAPASTRIAKPNEVELYVELAAAGWSEFPEVTPFIRDLARVSASAKGATIFFAEVDGEPVAAGALVMHDGVALLAGASTIPSARRRGAQRALLEARLAHAETHGCDLAMMCAAPGSASQRNAERQGFRIAYTRIKWGLV